MILRNPQALMLLAALPLFLALWRWRGRRVSLAAVALRLVSFTLIALALADPLLPGPVRANIRTIVLVDQSDSLGEAGKAALRARAAELVAGSQDDLTVLWFADDVIARAPTASGELAPFELATGATDLAAALRAAHELIGAGGGRVVLLSDGGQTSGDAVRAAQALAQDGIIVDTFAYAPPEQVEVWVAGVDLPPTLRVNESFKVRVAVGSTGDATGVVRVSNGDQLICQREVTLAAGLIEVECDNQAVRPGVVQLRATVEGQPDQIGRNNSLGATALVAPVPRVLLVEGQNADVRLFQAALRNAGVEPEVAVAATLPAQLSQLDAYEGIVLVDVPAGDLTLDQMTALREFVRSEGRGLVVTGGRSSLTLGAYKDTPLEEALPVEMTPPPRPRRSDVSLLLVIDQSASMGAADTVSKLDMALESAILSTEALRDEDRVGVLSFDTMQEWAVPFQQVGAGLGLVQIQEQIGAIRLGGGTDIYAALRVGLEELARQPGQVRHAVLLTDGKSYTTNLDAYRVLVDRARSQGITLSTIAIGFDADTELLQTLAEWGAGRYHFAEAPEDIPRLTLQESEIARTEPQIEGEFFAGVAQPHPILRDLSAVALPRLGGYVATTLKPAGELVLESPEDDPVLAVWHYGLGRAAVWTPSIEDPWAPAWSNWPEYGQFWAEIIRYVLPEPGSGLIQARVTASGDEVSIVVDSLEPGGAALDLADTVATVTLPDGSTQQFALRQVAPGRYARSVTLPADGPYTIDVRQVKDAIERTVSTGYVQPYPAEYLPVRDGPALLEAISTITGGQVLERIAAPAQDVEEAATPAPALRVWLLLVAALLWPLEVAVRRGWLRWGR